MVGSAGGGGSVRVGRVRGRRGGTLAGDQGVRRAGRQGGREAFVSVNMFYTVTVSKRSRLMYMLKGEYNWKCFIKCTFTGGYEVILACSRYRYQHI